MAPFQKFDCCAKMKSANLVALTPPFITTCAACATGKP
jgi:hypothetical protein